MQKTVKAHALFLICSFFSILSHSQITLKIPSTSPLPGEIKKLVADYPNHFSNILGDVIEKNPQSTDYNCSVKITGAEKSIITIYSSGKKTICGWEGLMLTTENFEDAKKKYKTLYTQLNNLSAGSGDGDFRFKGNYDAPVEEKKFAGSILAPDKKNDPFSKMKLEISMQYELMEWKVRLLIYDKEREDDEPGEKL
jgi:hypothetical protein